MGIEELCNKEVTELHEFFSNWYTGQSSSSEFTRFQRVLGPEFQIISPTSKVISRDELVTMIRKNYNTKSKMKIWVENVETRNISSNVYLTTYHELQELNGDITRRISTALFHTNAKCPNSVEWLHVHETWIN